MMEDAEIQKVFKVVMIIQKRDMRKSGMYTKSMLVWL